MIQLQIKAPPLDVCMQVSLWVHYTHKNVVIRLGIRGLDSLLQPTRGSLFLRPSSWCALSLISNPCRFLTTKLLKVSCSICSGDALICSAPYQGWGALSQHHWVWAHHREHCSDSSIMFLKKLLQSHNLAYSRQGKCPQKTMFCSQSLFCYASEWLLEKHWCTCCPESTGCLHSFNELLQPALQFIRMQLQS